MNSFNLSSKEGNTSKFLLNSDGTSQFEPQENVNISKKFYFKLASDLLKKLPIAPNKFLFLMAVPLKIIILIYLKINS